MTSWLPTPPTPDVRAAEVRAMHESMALRTPDATDRAVELDRNGAGSLWWSQAARMRDSVGSVRGLITTAAMGAAMAGAALVTQIAKSRYDLSRPFELDPTIKPLGPIPHDPSFPSGHAAASEAAALVLSRADPDHASEYEALAVDVAQARVYSGVHLPSDVAAGRQVGDMVGNWFS